MRNVVSSGRTKLTKSLNVSIKIAPQVFQPLCDFLRYIDFNLILFAHIIIYDEHVIYLIVFCGKHQSISQFESNCTQCNASLHRCDGHCYWNNTTCVQKGTYDYPNYSLITAFLVELVLFITMSLQCDMIDF